MEAVVLLAVAEALPELDGRPVGVGRRGALPVHPATQADLAACLHAMGGQENCTLGLGWSWDVF